MRYHRRENLIENYKRFFRKVDKSFADCFDVELILVACHLFRPKPTFEEAWSIVGGIQCWDHDQQAMSAKRAAKYIHRRYRDQYSQEVLWKQALQRYLELPEEYRMFLFDHQKQMWSPPEKPKKDKYQVKDIETVLLYLNECSTRKELGFPQRVQWPRTKCTQISNVRLFVYYHLLRDLPERKNEEMQELIPSGEYLYKEGEEYLKIQIEPRDDLYIQKLPVYRKKKQWLHNVADDERIKIGAKMDGLIGIQKWEKQALRSKLVSRKAKPTPFVYSEGYHHIVGGVGVGKNAFIEEEIYRMLKIEKRDVLIVVVLNKTSKGLELNHQLNQLGVPSTIIPGVYGKQNHEFEFIEQISKSKGGYRNLLQNKETLTLADSKCLFQIYHAVDNVERGLPCTPANRFKMKIGGKLEEVPCPYFMDCGLMSCYRKMTKANVWITTPYALKQTVIPKFVDTEKRTLQQLVHDLADVVYIDEVDEVMNVYDRDCVEETTITGDLSQLIPRLQDVTLEPHTNKFA